MSIPGIDWDEIAPKSGKPTEAEVNARAVAWEHEHAKSYAPCCAGPCDQGRRLCPSPDACQRAAQDFCGHTWADRLADWFWTLPLIERAGPGTGAALVAAAAVGTVAIAAAVWP